MTRIADLVAQLDTLARILGGDAEIRLGICNGDGPYLSDTVEVTTLTVWPDGAEAPSPPVALVRGHAHDGQGQWLNQRAEPDE